MISQQDYLSHYGNKCPSCSEEDVTEYDDIEFEGLNIIQEVFCNNCFSEWKNVYKMAGYTDLEEGDPE